MPFIGWNMKLNNYVGLKRGDRAGIKQMMDECRSHLQNNNSIYIFPEGTRSTTGELGKFRQGAFVLAKENETDILPVIIKNTDKLLVKNKFNTKGKIRLEITILPPVIFATFKDKSSQEITRLVREEFVKGL